MTRGTETYPVDMPDGTKYAKEHRRGYYPESTGLGKNANYARKHITEIIKLPEPGTRWGRDDLHDTIRDQLDAFAANGIVKRESKRLASTSTYWWTTVPEAYEYAEDRIENLDYFPCCGSAGFHNVRGGEFTCMNDGCDSVWSYDEIERIFR